MSDISLVFPTEAMEIRAVDFKEEFYANGERVIYGSYKLDRDRYSYLEWLNIIRSNLDKNKCNPKFGISHTFFAVRLDGKIVGIVNLRHTLTDFYKDSGHIGLSVRPSERNKGYATEILEKILVIAKSVGHKEVLVVCKDDNFASKKVIFRNHGQLNREFMKDKSAYEEYVIKLEG